MNKIDQKYPRVLAISPSTRGFGFAVFEGRDALINWGGKRVKGDKNARSLEKVDELISHYRPEVIVLEKTSAKGSRRAARIQTLTRRITNFATRYDAEVRLFSREQVKQVFFPSGKATKYAVAESIAQRFPEELGSRLPPKRKAYTSEDSRMDIFDAVGLILAFHRIKKNEIGRVCRNCSELYSGRFRSRARNVHKQEAT